MTFKAVIGASALAVMAAQAVQAADTVKIGALMIDSGPLAAFYQFSTKGLETAVAEVNAAGGVNGKPLELISVTYAGTPDAALQAITRLLKTDKVSAITGMIPTGVSLAVSGRASALDTIIMDPLSASGTRCNKNFFRIKASDKMQAASYDAYLKTIGIASWDVIAGDATSGHDNATSFANSVQGAGGTVQKQVFTPIPNADFGTYITQLSEAPAEGLMTIIYGTDGVNLSRQQQQFGLFSKYKVVLGNNYAVPAVLEAMGDSAEGVVQNLVYIPAAEAEGQVSFADAFRKQAGFAPDDVAFDMYSAVRFLAAGMNKAGNEKAADVSNALEGLVIDTALGPAEMRAADHQMARPMFFAKAVKLAQPVDGKTMGYEIQQRIEPQDYMPDPSADCKM